MDRVVGPLPSDDGMCGYGLPRKRTKQTVDFSDECGNIPFWSVVQRVLPIWMEHDANSRVEDHSIQAKLLSGTVLDELVNTLAN